MSRLRVRCTCCGTGFALRDNGYEDPAAATWCPRCGSRDVERSGASVQAVRADAA
jgi:rRNA maturation endonuclease Nob1